VFEQRQSVLGHDEPSVICEDRSAGDKPRVSECRRDLEARHELVNVSFGDPLGDVGRPLMLDNPGL